MRFPVDRFSVWDFGNFFLNWTAISLRKTTIPAHCLLAYVCPTSWQLVSMLFVLLGRGCFLPRLGCIGPFRENPIPNFPCGRVHEASPLIPFNIENNWSSWKQMASAVVSCKCLRPVLFQLCCQPLNRQRLSLRQLQAQFTGFIYCSAWVHRRAALLLWSVRTLFWQLVQDMKPRVDLVKQSWERSSPIFVSSTTPISERYRCRTKYRRRDIVILFYSQSTLESNIPM